MTASTDTLCKFSDSVLCFGFKLEFLKTGLGVGGGRLCGLTPYLGAPAAPLTFDKPSESLAIDLGFANEPL